MFFSRKRFEGYFQTLFRGPLLFLAVVMQLEMGDWLYVLSGALAFSIISLKPMFMGAHAPQK